MNLHTLQEKINLLYSKSHLKEYVFPRFSVQSSPDTSFAKGKPYDLNSQNFEPLIEKSKKVTISPSSFTKGNGKAALMVSSLKLKSKQTTETQDTKRILDTQLSTSPDQKLKPQHSINRVLKRKAHTENKSMGYMANIKPVTNYLQNQSGVQVLSKLFSNLDKQLINTTIDARKHNDAPEQPIHHTGKRALNLQLQRHLSTKNLISEMYQPKMGSPRSIKGPLSERVLLKSSRSIIEKSPKTGIQHFFVRPSIQQKEQEGRPKALTIALDRKAESFRSLLLSKKQTAQDSKAFQKSKGKM